MAPCLGGQQRKERLEMGSTVQSRENGTVHATEGQGPATQRTGY